MEIVQDYQNHPQTFWYDLQESLLQSNGSCLHFLEALKQRGYVVTPRPELVISPEKAA